MLPELHSAACKKSNMALKEPEAVLVLCSSGQAEAQTYSPASRGGPKNPSPLNNRASCQGIATVLLPRPGTSIPALFRKNDINEISKTVRFHFHKVTASTGIISLPLPLSARGLAFYKHFQDPTFFLAYSDTFKTSCNAQQT